MSVPSSGRVGAVAVGVGGRHPLYRNLCAIVLEEKVSDGGDLKESMSRTFIVPPFCSSWRRTGTRSTSRLRGQSVLARVLSVWKQMSSPRWAENGRHASWSCPAEWGEPPLNPDPDGVTTPEPPSNRRPRGLNSAEQQVNPPSPSRLPRLQVGPVG